MAELKNSQMVGLGFLMIGAMILAPEALTYVQAVLKREHPEDKHARLKKKTTKIKKKGK
jgi:ribose 5-phosphate isomerase RpiB